MRRAWAARRLATVAPRSTIAFATSSPFTLSGEKRDGMFEIGKVGEWKGYVGADGKKRTVRITEADIDAAIATLSRQSNPIMLDYGHASLEDPAAKAAGWIDRFEKRGTGDGARLWAHVTFSAPAYEAAKNDEYRFFSPTWVKDSIDRVTGELIPVEIPCVALTNLPFQDGLQPIALSRFEPRIRMTKESTPMAADPQTTIDALMKLLGVSDPEALVAAVQQMIGEESGEPPEAAPMSLVIARKHLTARDTKIAALEGQVSALSTKVKAYVDAETKAAEKALDDAAAAKVEGLIKDGRALPTQKDALVKFARSDVDGFDKFAKELPQLVPVGKRQAGKGSAMAPAGTDPSLDPTDPVVIEMRRQKIPDALIAKHHVQR